MTTSDPSDRARRVNAGRDALAEIRAAEAARMLGLLVSSELPARAGEWLAAGVDTPNVRALAGASAEVTAGVRAALLAEIAGDTHQAPATLAEARAIHAETVIARMTAHPAPGSWSSRTA